MILAVPIHAHVDKPPIALGVPSWTLHCLLVCPLLSGGPTWAQGPVWPERAQAEGDVHRPCQEGGDIQRTGLQLSGPCHFSPQRAIRVRSHSMETMVSSQKKQHSGGIPGSLSGGISHNSMEVTKTTFSVSAAGPGGCPGSQGAPLGLPRRVHAPRRGPGDQSRTLPVKWSLHPSQVRLGLAQKRSPPCLLPVF